MNTSFKNSLLREFITNTPNYHHNNYDFDRFGGKPGVSLLNKVRGKIREKLRQRGYYQINVADFNKRFDKIAPYLDGLEKTYQLLNDEFSKNIMVKVFAYRIMGNKKVKLPTNNPEYWESLAKMKKAASRANDHIHSSFMNMKVPLIDLNEFDYPYKLYIPPNGINIIFRMGQYEYHGSIDIQATEGDIVIDGGACWGDTAVYFAGKVGMTGNVYPFEFIPSNIEIIRRNLELNPSIKDRVHAIEQPLWDASGVKMYFKDDGPASKVELNDFKGSEGTTTTLTIDDLVIKENLKSVDFIKMDIEGAEFNALNGALETIKKFRPKLGISVYHSTEDFVRIPAFINSLGLGYKFYMNHYTIHSEETILFAVAE